MPDADAPRKLQEYATTLQTLLAQAERDVADAGTLSKTTRERVHALISALSDDLFALYAESSAGRLGPPEREHLLPVVEEIRAVLRGSAGFRDPSSALARLRSAATLVGQGRASIDP
ncbi:MAG: hypothetical protein O9284_00230 [Steroidobacteraceae bacterium]|jgi:hypothetical protein|nr:hypothetical protein [Steroidobacteraceae bacterium]